MKSEPALIVGALAAVLVALANTIGVHLDSSALGVVLLPVITALFIRPVVKPKRKP